MPTPRSAYTKLTRRRRRVGGYSQLWVAPDHILLVNSSRFSEEYKRFAFSDIQTIVVTELPSNIVPQIVMILAALAWMSLWFAVDSRFLKWTIEVIGAFALLWPIVDIVRGPRSRAFLHTRVSRELLEPVNRMKTALDFLETIRPRVEAVQGVLPLEGFVTSETAPAVAPPPEIASSPPYLPEIAFAIFLVNAILIWASVHFPKHQEFSAVVMNTTMGEILLIVVTLLRRRGRDTRVVVYVVLVLAAVGMGFDVVTFAREIFGWFTTLQEKARHGDKSITLIKLFPAGGYRTTVAYTWRTAAGIAGLAAAFWERRGLKR